MVFGEVSAFAAFTEDDDVHIFFEFGDTIGDMACFVNEVELALDALFLEEVEALFMDSFAFLVF